MRPPLALALPLCAALSGCAHYTSSYWPPPDGRARVLFTDNRAVMSVASTTDECLAAAGSESAAPRYVRRTYGGGGGGLVFWAPGPVGRVNSGPSGAPSPASRAGAHPFVGGASHGSSSHTGSSGGSKGDGGKEAYIILAVAVIVVSPLIAYGLSLSRAEPEGEVAATIDRVNAYNDLVRWPGTPCSDPALAGAP